MANRFERSTWSATLALAVLAVTCCARAVLADDAQDTSAPKKAAMAFCKAVLAGDMDQVHALSTGTDREYSLLKLLSDAARSSSKFRDAATKKFGDQSKFFDDLQMDMTKDFQTADVRIDGNTATLVVKSKPDDKFPPTLKKDGSGWKMDLSNLDKEPDAVAMSVKMLPSMTKVFDNVTKNLNDDKYKTFADLTTDFQQQFTAALTPPAPAADAPAPDAPKK